MRKKFAARLICLFLFSFALGRYVTHDVWRKHLMGKDGYLQYQSNFFDKRLAVIPHPHIKVMSYTIVFGLLFLSYEGVVYLLWLILRPSDKKAEHAN